MHMSNRIFEVGKIQIRQRCRGGACIQIQINLKPLKETMHTMWNSPWNQPRKTELLAPALMESLDINADDFDFHPQVYYTNKNSVVKPCSKCNNNNNKSFLLMNGQKTLHVPNVEEFLNKLSCTGNDTKIKVVSIFGNTGDGKRHTMNHVFFKGKEVFKTSNNHNCCALGIWAAFDPVLNVICLDTEGLQGVTSCESEQALLLVKVLAVSDIIIYGNHSERLNRDLFTFLGTASRAYSHYFKGALQAIGQIEGISSSSLSTFGPSIIVFHETRDSKPLTNNGAESVEDMLRTRLGEMALEIDAFSSIKYVGVQSVNNVMNYEQLRSAIETEVNNTTVRMARKPFLVYNTLKLLNEHLSTEKKKYCLPFFPEQYFTCPAKCLSCANRCNKSMGHHREAKPHSTSGRCKYECQYENAIYLCKKCYKNGKQIEVKRYQDGDQNSSWYGFATTVLSGYVLECSRCGVIYRSKQYWYGNNPEDIAIRKKVTHVWGVPNPPPVPQNTAQRVMDSVSYITEAVATVSLQPTKALKAWAADQVAPSYWRPNSEIKHCHKCKTVFGLARDKHHCRDCGEGFCDKCSSKTRCVPSRNWYSPVRVCDTCYEKETNSSSNESLEPAEDVSVRKVTEHVVSTFSVVGTVFNYSKSFIKDSVRPSYWVPDSEIVNCNVCECNFSARIPLHHCRACGYGVCHGCSQHRKPVPHRGWDHPVRVCDFCVLK
ncbi:hypothetical protein DMN91_005013 [Ooceraea biroi]|uniref:FYVE-type domain-containing protein n=1 Tax=Ooceraea biroi TaxID=2015173 RepID=A0A3L8DQL8_OOCBI|nr:zinc finger FYVE domain-containing protein 1-like isoform X2 [Ooceraea biroi]RLU22735.1 hypothetical protein DMN91_005013 [Ooceraea biroi]